MLWQAPDRVCQLLVLWLFASICVGLPTQDWLDGVGGCIDTEPTEQSLSKHYRIM